MGVECQIGKAMCRGYVENVKHVKLLPETINGVYQVVERVLQRLWVENTEQVKLYGEAIGGAFFVTTLEGP
jgi:hypothetical protein